MIYAAVLIGMFTLHLMLKMHWITTGVVTVYLLFRVRAHSRWYRQADEQQLRFFFFFDYVDTKSLAMPWIIFTGLLMIRM